MSKAEAKQYANDNVDQLLSLLENLANPQPANASVTRGDYRHLQSAIQSIASRLVSIEEGIAAIQETLRHDAPLKMGGFGGDGGDGGEEDESVVDATRKVKQISQSDPRPSPY